MDENFYKWLDVNFPDWCGKYKWTNDFTDYKNQLGFIYEWWLLT